jgi:ribosome-associated translation inhibitor RaiA
MSYAEKKIEKLEKQVEELKDALFRVNKEKIEAEEALVVEFTAHVSTLQELIDSRKESRKNLRHLNAYHAVTTEVIKETK